MYQGTVIYSVSMRCRPSNINRILRMPPRFLLLGALLAGTVSAQYSEITTYNDEACHDLNSTLVVNGIFGKFEISHTEPLAFRREQN